MRRSLLLLFFTILFSTINAEAQTTGCKDTLHANPTYSCPDAVDDYNPVCGCDGKTYRNSCIATNRNGIQYYTNGICNDFDFYFTPNPVSYSLRYAYYAATYGTINIFIYNAQGYVITEQRRYAVPGFTQFDEIDVSTLDNGIYLLVMLKDGVQQVKKFARFTR